MPNCHRKACQAPNANWYNISTREYYCERCAKRINHWNPGLCSPASPLAGGLSEPEVLERMRNIVEAAAAREEKYKHASTLPEIQALTLGSVRWELLEPEALQQVFDIVVAQPKVTFG